MNRRQGLRAAVVVVASTTGLALLASFGPLQLPTVLAYSGIVLAICGVLSLLVPAAWLGFSRRRTGLLFGTAAGILFFAAGWLWPAGSFTTTSPGSRLDTYMPAYNFHERHEIMVEASPERVREVLNQVSISDIGVMQTLGTIRAIAMNRGQVNRTAQGAPPTVPFVRMVMSPRSGFFPLEDTPREFVFGLAGQPWNNAGVRLRPEEFRTWSPPDNVKLRPTF